MLHEILDWIPAHPAAHGFTRGRSVVSHAASHVGEYAVLRIDLEDFFASIAAARVYGIFRAAGYPEAVAHVLTGLTHERGPAGGARAASPRPDARPRLVDRRHVARLAPPARRRLTCRRARRPRPRSRTSPRSASTAA